MNCGKPVSDLPRDAAALVTAIPIMVWSKFRMGYTVYLDYGILGYSLGGGSKV